MIRQQTMKKNILADASNPVISNRTQTNHGKRSRCAETNTVKAVKVRKWSQSTTSNLGINTIKTLLKSNLNSTKTDEGSQSYIESSFNHFTSSLIKSKDIPSRNSKQTNLFPISHPGVSIPYKRIKTNKKGLVPNCTGGKATTKKIEILCNEKLNSNKGLILNSNQIDSPSFAKNTSSLLNSKNNKKNNYNENCTLLKNFSLFSINNNNNPKVGNHDNNNTTLDTLKLHSLDDTKYHTSFTTVSSSDNLSNLTNICNQLSSSNDLINSYSVQHDSVSVPNFIEIAPQSNCNQVKMDYSSQASFCSPTNYDSNEICINSYIVIPKDRDILIKKEYISSLRKDTASYGQDWFSYHKKKESNFDPWQISMTGKIEKLRLGVISMYWNSASMYPISPATIHVAINNFSRLLHYWHKTEVQHPSAARWALTAVVAFRLAFKAEERPEVVWEVTNFWNIFPMFKDWDIDRSEENVNKVELEALRALDDAMDVPLGPMFLSLYITAAGWPEELSRDYHELSLYLIALTTFASTKDHLLRNIRPSRLAAAALVLSVKIINGDRASNSSILGHLKDCPYPNLCNESQKSKKDPGIICQTPNSTITTAATVSMSQQKPSTTVSVLDSCICRYEFYPERLKTYSGLTLEELLPVIKGLSSLLRSKPSETCVLNHFFPVWADNDWQ